MNENPDDSAKKQKSQRHLMDSSKSTIFETNESKALPETFHKKSEDNAPESLGNVRQFGELANQGQGNVLVGVLIFAGLLCVDLICLCFFTGRSNAAPPIVFFVLAIAVTGTLAACVAGYRSRRRGIDTATLFQNRRGSLGNGVAAAGFLVTVVMVAALAIFNLKDSVPAVGTGDQLPIEALEAKTAFSRRNFQMAVEKYTAAIAKEPRIPKLYEERAFCYAELSEDKKGLADLTQVLNLHASPNEVAKALDLRARYNFKLGHYVESVEDCTRAIAVEEPSDGSFHLDRANAYKKLGLNAEAKKDLEKARHHIW